MSSPEANLPTPDSGPVFSDIWDGVALTGPWPQLSAPNYPLHLEPVESLLAAHAGPQESGLAGASERINLDFTKRLLGKLGIVNPNAQELKAASSARFKAFFLSGLSFADTSQAIIRFTDVGLGLNDMHQETLEVTSTNSLQDDEDFRISFEQEMAKQHTDESIDLDDAKIASLMFQTAHAQRMIIRRWRRYCFYQSIGESNPDDPVPEFNILVAAGLKDLQRTTKPK